MAAAAHPAPPPTDGVPALLVAALTGDDAARRTAEATLSASSAAPGFATALLSAATAPGLPHPVRQLAAVLLKRIIRTHWGGEEGEEQVRGERGGARVAISRCEPKTLAAAAPSTPAGPRTPLAMHGV